jgi:hypothetical protein
MMNYEGDMAVFDAMMIAQIEDEGRASESAAAEAEAEALAAQAEAEELE